MMKHDSPCYKCAEHSAECHAKCESYAGWRKDYEQAIKKDAGQRAVDQFIIGNTMKVKLRRSRRR